MASSSLNCTKTTMTNLRKLLCEYEDVRFDADDESTRFLFDSDAERFVFIRRLSEINAEYMFYTDKNLYKIEVFFNDDNDGKVQP